MFCLTRFLLTQLFMARPKQVLTHEVSSDLTRMMVTASFAGKSKEEKFIILSQMPGMTISEARRLAGYAPGDHKPKSALYKETVRSIEEQRSELQSKPGYTLEDNATYFKDISDTCKTGDPEVGIKARSKLVDMMGHNAPKEVHVTEAVQIGFAIKSLTKILGGGSIGRDMGDIPGIDAVDIDFEEITSPAAKMENQEEECDPEPEQFQQAKPEHNPEEFEPEEEFAF
jgi:hypothetical protein